MSATLPPRTSAVRTRPRATSRVSPRVRSGVRSPALRAFVHGLLAAAIPLAVTMALGVIGWFLTETGTHGSSTDGVRIGALLWLVAHGSSVHLTGSTVTVAPLALTAVAALATWRRGRHLGERCEGAGRETLSGALLLFTLGYLVVVFVVVAVASVGDSEPKTGRAVLGALAVVAAFGWTGVLRGSGVGSAILARMPAAVSAGLRTAPALVGWWLAVSALAVAAAFLVDLDTAVNIGKQLQLDAGGLTVLVALTVGTLPNAALFASAYLLGSQFVVGSGTLVSTAAVDLGPLPMLPVFAALPDQGTPPSWAGMLFLLAPLVGAAVAWRRIARQASSPGVVTVRDAVVMAVVAAAVAAVVLGVLSALAGGALGPGRMADFGPDAMGVLWRAAASFAVGGALAGTLRVALRGRA